MNEKLELVATLLKGESTLALATTDDSGLSKVAPLFYMVDEALCLYWISAASSEHAKNLKREPRASVTVYRPTDNWKDIRGVQMRGHVCPVRYSTHKKALIRQYSDRFDLGAIFRQTIARSTLYKFCPHFVRYMDNSRHFGYKFDLVFAADE